MRSWIVIIYYILLQRNQNNYAYRTGLNAAPNKIMIIYLSSIRLSLKFYNALRRGKSTVHIIKTSHCYSTKQGQGHM